MRCQRQRHHRHRHLTATGPRPRTGPARPRHRLRSRSGSGFGKKKEPQWLSQSNGKSLRRMTPSTTRSSITSGRSIRRPHGVIDFVTQTNGEIIRARSRTLGTLPAGWRRLARRSATRLHAILPTASTTWRPCLPMKATPSAVERLLKVEIPPRAKYCAPSRASCAAFHHWVAVGTMASGHRRIHALTHAWRARAINDLRKSCAGAPDLQLRRIGGVVGRRARGAGAKRSCLPRSPDSYVQEYDRLIRSNQIYVKRLANVAVIIATRHWPYGLWAQSARLGNFMDARRDLAYARYPEFQFDVPVVRGRMERLGLLGSLRRACGWRCWILQDCSPGVAKLPEGEDHGQGPTQAKPEPGEAMGRVESARGTCATT